MKNWMKYCIGGILCLTFLVGSVASISPMVYAVEDGMVELGEKKEEEKKKERPTHDKSGRPILSETAVGILIDGKNGNVLYESDSDKKMYPASTTKIMTALIALEAVENKTVSMDQKVTITEEMLKDLAWDSSTMGLKVGEVISFQDLMYGLMIPSGNDAAMAIAYAVSGSCEAFVNRMNQRAAEMGLTKTKFKNPHGFHEKGHYTTAAEMAIISWHAMKNQNFRDIVEIAHIKIPPTNMSEEERYFINTNGLVSNMRYTQFYYEGANGIKTGYTDDAGNCLVASAKRGNVELIAVLFHGKGVENSHGDSARMLDYGFTAFEQMIPVKQDQMMGEVKVKWGSSRESVTASAVAPIPVLVPKGTKLDEIEVKLNLPEFVKAPVEKEAIVGTVQIMLDGMVVGEGELSADLTVKRSFLWPLYAFLEWLWGFLFIRILCYLILTVLGVFILLLFVRVWREFSRVRQRNLQARNRSRRK